MTIGVYMIEHVATGRRYVGKSVDVRHRISVHFTPGQMTRTASHIHLAIAKYGRAAFSWTLLEECADDTTARAREVYWISALRTRTPHGFNLTDGGDGTAGACPSAAARARMSEARRGKTRSAEVRTRMSAAQCGRVQSEAAKAKISAANTGNKYCVGRKISAETRAKLSKANRGRTVSAETRATRKGKVPARNARAVSPETRARLSEASRGRTHSEETLAKMRVAQRSRRLAEKENANA